ncbi:GIY-YIG nuclease family protein [Ramlibacter sp. MMS24-I3-19]|uniref:GIY-YIG nuclease family protein n=1 Tax=Ramlibacter sp. MMS24-I3-19 TaxID=3416606 RepID=UPI003D02143D
MADAHGTPYHYRARVHHFQPAVYMLASRKWGTLYIGVTSNLAQRVWQHRQHLVPGFTSTHDVSRLVWYEMHDGMAAAITREKRLKKWDRLWKLRLVSERNPEWMDLFDEICR